MAYSLRSRSALTVNTEKATPTTTVKKPAAKKATSTTKKAAVAKKPLAAPKKAAAPTKKAAEAKAKTDEPVVADVKPKKTPAKKPTVAKKSTSTATKKTTSPAKKSAISKKTPTKVTTAKAKAPARKAAIATKKTESAPVVKIEEIDEELLSPSVPEIEPISHEEILEEEEVVKEINEEPAILNTHIRFSDDEEEEGEVLEAKEASVNSNDFEALDEELNDESEPFVLYESEESEKEKELIEDGDLTMEETIEESFPVTNPHSAFEAFTSPEEPKTFNWNHSGSTYYQEKTVAEPEISKIEDIPSLDKKEAAQSSPIVISNPFGFGFTTTTAPEKSQGLDLLSNNIVSRPNPYTFNSHFQSVSSPLEKLCSLTSQSNPLPIVSSSVATSYLPTSPAAGMRKGAQSPINDDEKEARSPSTIQSIIVDDKHEDFSAF